MIYISPTSDNFLQESLKKPMLISTPELLLELIGFLVGFGHIQLYRPTKKTAMQQH
jgi:hypothetical protein